MNNKNRVIKLQIIVLKYLSKLNKNNPILWYLFVLMILSQTPWTKAVIFLAIPLLIHLELHKNKKDSLASNKVFLLKLIVFIGFVSGLLHFLEYDLYYFGRDIMYFIQAPVFILMGIYLCKNIQDYKVLIKAIVLSSILITIYKLIELSINPSLIFKLGLVTRYEYDLSNPTALLAFIILFYARKLEIKLFKNFIEWLIMVVSLFSVIISFSRTFYILLLVLIIIFYISKYKLILKIYWFTVFCALFVVFGGLFLNVNSESSQGSTFQSKMSHSLDEIIVKDYRTSYEINQNWRGYEAFLGLSKFYKGNFIEILFGQGFGVVVYTPNWIFGEEQTNLNILPMFHNGFITILLKTGLVGLLIFFLFLFKLLQTVPKVDFKTLNKQQQFTALLLRSAVFTILFQTFVVHGIFTTSIPFLLIVLIGASIKMNISENRFLNKKRNEFIS